MKFKAKDRMALVNKKNMKRLTEYFDREGCIDFDLSWAVNYLIDIALKEITLRELEAIVKDTTCDGCEYAVQCNIGDKNYYCDHEGRIDDIGKLSIDNLMDASPEWCPLREE